MHRKILWMGYFLQVDCILSLSPLILFFSKQKKNWYHLQTIEKKRCTENVGSERKKML